MTKLMGIVIIILSKKTNNCDCKIKINYPMKGMCNLENVVYQENIFPKENKKNLKSYIGISTVWWKLR